MLAGYDIVYGKNDADLIKKVNEKLPEGWQPVGNPSPIGLKWCQAIVKPKE